jgi:undecaprenyl-diphosphatase
VLRAIVLGLVQGLTEFLPVSSSGHLVVVPYLFSWRPPGLAFGVALHVGTLVAVLAYFFGDVWYLATRSVGVGVREPGEAGRARRTVALLAVGSVPAAAAGLLLEGVFEDAFAQPLWVAGFFLMTAGLLYGAEALRRRRARLLARAVAGGNPGGGVTPATDTGRDETTVCWVDVLVIGTFQALALFPGISRSGSTIAAGMFRGLSRAAAARFSFLLMIPAVAGATILELPDLVDAEIGGFSAGQAVAGAVAAAVSGYWAVRYLLRLVTTDDLTGFARYLVFAAILVGVGYLWIGPVSQL